jgi:hypothetical protein
MTTVYYNFPVISLSLQGVASPSSNEIQLPHVGQPLTNVQLNNVNYSAYSVIVASSESSSNTPGYLIVKCYADVNDLTSNLLYLAVPLKVPPPDGSPQPSSSDVDNIINASGGTTTVNLNLNNYIKSGGSCVVPSINSFPVTVTLDSTSAIPIQQYVNKPFYTIGSIPSLAVNSNVSNNKNAIVQQQDLDWIMSCELLTEDGPTEKQKVDPGTTATTITLFMMVIIISFATYTAGPILYNGLGMFNLASKTLNGNHYSINVFWGATLILLAVMCIIQGIKSNDTIYYFIAIALILSFFSATSGVMKLKGVANAEETGFANTDGALKVYSEIFSRNCYSTTGFVLKILVFVFLVYSFLAMSGSMASGNQFVFVTHMLMFIGVSVLQLSAISYFNKISNPSSS